MAKSRKKELPTDAQLTEQGTAAHMDQVAQHLPDTATDPSKLEAARELQQEQVRHTDGHHGHGSHAEAVGKRPFTPHKDPFSLINDYVAGVKLSESRQHGEMIIAFREKPSAAVLEKMRDGHFQWHSRDKVWTRKLGDDPMTVRIDAERLHREVSGMIREEKGVAEGHGVPG
jgi:hypothetical protein